MGVRFVVRQCVHESEAGPCGGVEFSKGVLVNSLEITWDSRMGVIVLVPKWEFEVGKRIDVEGYARAAGTIHTHYVFGLGECSLDCQMHESRS